MNAMLVRLVGGSVLVAAIGGVGLQTSYAADPDPGCPSDPETAGVALQTSIRFADDNPGTTVELTAGCTYTLRQDDSTATYLPITANMTIHGNGATVNRPADTAHFLMFEVHESVTLTMSNVTVSSAIDGHGHLARAIWLRPTATGTFSHLTIDQGGPGIYNGGTLNVDDSNFVGINARNTRGGAIENDGTMSVERTAFTRNHVWGGLGELQAGGAIKNGGTAFIGESTFTSNDGFVAGAIDNGGSLDIRDTTFDSNSATLDGGAIKQGGGPTLLLRDTFKSNNVPRSGGAIYATGGNMVINETTFYANRAVHPFNTNLVGRGGAIYGGVVASFENDTFSNNVGDSGSDIYGDDTGSMTMFGTVLNGNSDICAGDATIYDAGYNWQTTASSACPGTFAVGNPMLGTLGDHGGLTETMPPRAGSPLIDAIPIADCPTKDQRNFDRPAGAGCEIGSVEDQLPSQPGQVTLASGTNPNQGDFGLEWDASTDPEGAVTYNLYRQDDDDSAPTLVGTTSGPSYTFTSGAPEQEGTLVYWAEAVDSAGQTSMSDPASDPIVVDRSAPTGLTASADRAPDYVDPNTSDGWWADTVTVSFANATDPALPDGSDGSGVASTPASATYTTSGSHTASGQATDNAGNDSPAASLTVHVDADNPTASFTSCPTTVFLSAVSSVGWTANDASSGLASAASGSVPLVTSTVGPHQVQSPAPEDNVGHVGDVATCAYTVIYNFTGFIGLPAYPGFSRITATVGTSVSFSLAGNQGLAVLATAPTSMPINCSTGASTGAATPAATKKGLTYNSSNGRYSWQWVTDRTMAKTCRQLIVSLNDGTVHRANFELK